MRMSDAWAKRSIDESTSSASNGFRHRPGRMFEICADESLAGLSESTSTVLQSAAMVASRRKT